jgi:cytochrome b6-f complex subunit 5
MKKETLKEFGDLNKTIFYLKNCITILNQKIMVEPLLSGIVLGLLFVTIAGLFVTAYLQYRRGDLATF